MKKYLWFLPFLLLFGTNSFAQSIKFSNLVFLATLDNDDVYQNLRQTDVFKQDYSEVVDGYPMEYFNKAGARPDFERIAVGRYIKLYNGVILRTLDYTSTDTQIILNMVSQAKDFGMDLQFRGADELYNIYMFTNSSFSVNIYIRRDQTSGLVEIKQKEYVQID